MSESPLKPILDLVAYVQQLEGIKIDLTAQLTVSQEKLNIANAQLVEMQATLDEVKNQYAKDARLNAVVNAAYHYMGLNVPYSQTVHQSPENGFDCSGFVQRIFDEGAGISLPRLAGAQSKAGIEVNMTDENDWLPGDLIFFKWTKGDKTVADHVGMYLGYGLIIHTATPQVGIIVRRWKDYYDDDLLAVRRVL